jgi:hypothetical protein
MAMKQKRRSADPRDSRKTRASSASIRSRRAIRRSRALRGDPPLHRALSEVPVPDPDRFYAIRAIRVNGTLEAARKTSLFPVETGTSKRRFRAIRSRKIAKVVLNAFKTQVAAGAGGRGAVREGMLKFPESVA